MPRKNVPEKNAKDKIVVFVTAANLRQAKAIARNLIQGRLAACVNLLRPVLSVYRWEGNVKEDREVLLIIKTQKNLFAAVRDAVLRLHSYDTPEVIALPVTEGSADYLAWIDASVEHPKAPLRR